MLPPVEREGGHLAVLLRVAEGTIIKPESRVPERARQVKIPGEVSAIAMKALSKAPEDRYQTVEALRRDIERFLEGRSVTAKEDTPWEILVKLVRRNKAASVTTLVGLVILVVVLAISFTVINDARITAESANEKYLAAEKAKRAQAKDSVPAYLRAARLAVNDRKFEDALVQAETALEYVPDDAEARLLKGKLLIVLQDFKAAAEELEKYAKLRPVDQGAARLKDICVRAKRDDQATQLAAAAEFTEQNEFPLADGMFPQFGENAVAGRKLLLGLYRKRIDAAWPGLGGKLSIDRAGKVNLNFNDCKQVADLGPLKGLPLASLNLYQCGLVRDLSPLQEMPLTHLDLSECREVRDLKPLKGMKLHFLRLHRCNLVRDLTPLQSMPLTYLDLAGTSVNDLTPLQGMPLTGLNLTDTQVKDLTPLRGMPLTGLSIFITAVRDLTPLEGTDLERISLEPRKITKGMEILKQMKSLKSIGVSWTGGYPPEEFWRKYEAGEFKN